MRLSPRLRTRRLAVCASFVALAWAFAGSLPAAAAAPTERPSVVRATTDHRIVTKRIGPVAIAVDATSTAIGRGTGFSFLTTVRSSEPLSYLQVRMRLLMPEGSLVYQKTFVSRAEKDEAKQFTFERPISDIDLEPDSYPVEISVRFSAQGQTTETVLPARVLVYDDERAPLSMALIARVSALPLTNPDGAVVVDPSVFTRARDDVVALADWVVDDPKARVGLALSPMMLEEWEMITHGYRYETPEGPVDVPSTYPVPLAYASALSRLSQATRTGRMEVLSQGYSDPDVAQLEVVGLGDDIQPQYAEGSLAILASVGTTASPVTAPASGRLNLTSARRLYAAGIRAVAISPGTTRRAGVNAVPGTHPIRGSSMRGLIYDGIVTRSLVETGGAEAVSAAFARYLERGGSTVPVVIPVGPGSASAEDLIAFARTMTLQPWSRLVLPSRATPSKSSVDLRKIRPSKSPKAYWETIAEARRWASGLMAAYAGSVPAESTAQKNSLIAEAYAWEGAAKDWRHAERAFSYAKSASTEAHEVLGKVGLLVRPVTLAGTRGQVPLTVVNNSGRSLRVKLATEPSPGMSAESALVKVVDLQPQENFVEVPVDLQGALNGQLKVRVMAGDAVIDGETVPLAAGIIDRLVLLGGIVLVLGGLLAFIIWRVRTADLAAESPSAEG